MGKDRYTYAVVISKIIITTPNNALSVDVQIYSCEEFPTIEILNVSISHLDDISGIELPINFNSVNFRETPALLFDEPSHEIYFKSQILKYLKRTSFVLKFFEPELIPQIDT